LSSFVLDASVALRWFLDKNIPDYAINTQKLLVRGGRATVPSIWILEMANALVVAERRRILSSGEVDMAIRSIDQLASIAIEIDCTVPSLSKISSASRAFGLSVYDAAYLELASRETLPLATLDEQLRAAAHTAGIAVL
jgi:predicted nucleic acid-binding protein